MSLVWEEDYDVFAKDGRVQWHLKRLVARDPKATPPYSLANGPYKVSLAWVIKRGERKYEVRLLKHAYNWKDNDKTFRSLKAAKAYALAVVALDQ